MRRLCIVCCAIAASFIWVAPALGQVQRVQLGVLVLSAGEAGTAMMKAGLDEALVPFTEIDLNAPNRPQIDAALLADSLAPNVRRAKFQAVVLPNEAPQQLTAAELAALDAFEREFKVRQLNAYVYPSAAVGLSAPSYSGPLDGRTATLTTAGRSAAFAYLQQDVPFDDLDAGVTESHGFLALPLPADSANQRELTPLLDMPIPGSDSRGVLVGVYNDAGREQLVVTAAMNAFQLQQQLLFPGILSWLTYGVYLGSERNYLAVHIDDVFLGDQRWVSEQNCTAGDDCPGTVSAPEIHMTAQDVIQLLSWQRQRGLLLDMVWNGLGYDAALAETGSSPMGDMLLTHRAELRWINHTYTHAYLGCIQDFSVLPWRCVNGPDAPDWLSAADIQSEISLNRSFAATHGIAMDEAELVNGEHSGLRRVPQEPSDNPNLAPALNALGIRWLGSDNSRESAQRSVGDALTVPRYPMNIFYNVGTRSEEVDEYNWIYNSRADGGSGVCESDPSSTCIAPLDVQTGFASYIVPQEARSMLLHVLANSPRPHYAHGAKLAEDRILYGVLDSCLARYRALWSPGAPLINPSLAQAGSELQRQARWRSERAQVSGYIEGKRLRLRSDAGVLAVTSAPLTLPTSVDAPQLEPYTTSRTGWLEVRGFLGSSYVLPDTTQAGAQSCLECDAMSCPAQASSCSDAACADVFTCLMQSGCALSASPERCYCGANALAECAATGGDGTCRAAIVAATGTSDHLANLQAINDPSHPVGAAFERALCDRDLCASACSSGLSVTAVPSLGRGWLAALGALLLAVGVMSHRVARRARS